MKYTFVMYICCFSVVIVIMGSYQKFTGTLGWSLNPLPRLPQPALQCLIASLRVLAILSTTVILSIPWVRA